MDLDEFNRLSADEAADRLRDCVAIDSFAETVTAGRPYRSVPALLSAAETHTGTWTEVEVEAALADHPRIGERPTARSRREQAGVRGEDVQQRLRDGNRRYEQRFGRIYLVRAAGRSGDELLAMLERRLRNDPATELDVTRQQLAEITMLRLEGMVTP